MSADRFDPKQAAARLLAHLRRLNNDRGVIADLRCALNPTTLPRAWRWLGPVNGIGNRRIETVAGLFAYHPDETHTGNLGTTCRRLAAESNSFDGRFRRLLSCDRDEICERLRPVILAARAKDIKVNYERLFTDLCYWNDYVKASWAREYWGVPEGEDSAAVTASEATP